MRAEELLEVLKLEIEEIEFIMFKNKESFYSLNEIRVRKLEKLREEENKIFIMD